MSNQCVVVADGARARIFVFEPGSGRADASSLVEKADLTNAEYGMRGTEVPQVRSEHHPDRQTGPVHPVSEKREQHRLEVERRFGMRVAERVAAIVAGWEAGSVVLVAEPRLLSLMREALRKAVKPGIALKELAKDYAHLSAAELYKRLALDALCRLPGRRT